MDKRKVSNSDSIVKYKVSILGESGVGKTSILNVLNGQPFHSNLLPTVGIDFVTSTFEVEGAKVQLQVWDTAGQERFRSITRFHYRGTKGIVLVYDITNKETFSMVDYWMESIDRDLDRNNTEPVPIFLIGNKCDLVDKREVATAKGKKAADANFVHGFLETSAKINTNIETVFSDLAHAMVEIYDPKLLHSYQTTEEQLRRKLDTAERIIENNRETRKNIKEKQKKMEKAKNLATLHLTPQKEDKASCVCSNG